MLQRLFDFCLLVKLPPPKGEGEGDGEGHAPSLVAEPGHRRRRRHRHIGKDRLLRIGRLYGTLGKWVVGG
jgi:hypothetical protein